MVTMSRILLLIVNFREGACWMMRTDSLKRATIISSGQILSANVDKI